MESLKPGEERGARAVWIEAFVSPEVRIVAEVAFQLRISPKYTDDGAPEGTCEKPAPVSVPGPTNPAAPRKPSEPDIYQMNP